MGAETSRRARGRGLLDERDEVLGLLGAVYHSEATNGRPLGLGTRRNAQMPANTALSDKDQCKTGSGSRV